MYFYVGVYTLSRAHHFQRCFISVNRFTRRRRVSDFEVNSWIMDSGAFTQIEQYGEHTLAPAEYAALIRRWSRCGTLEAAVTQDYMCEPAMLDRTGMTVEEHQRLTIERYDALVAEDPGVYVMPVLQGYNPAEYARCVDLYGDRLGENAWVGVGSVCKRNANPQSIIAVLSAIRSRRPDLRLHGFGVKTTALGVDVIRKWFYSADSMAWSIPARRHWNRVQEWNAVEEAKRFAYRIETQPVQLSFNQAIEEDFGG